MLVKNLSEKNFFNFEFWNKLFKQNSIESIEIEIPKNVLNYLRDDIIILPKECNQNDDTENDEFECEPNFNADDYDDDDNSDSDDESIEIPEFPEFSNRILNGIKELGGSVFIKTNWNAPRDAFWITAGQTLKVKDLTDFYQLLKASSIVKENLRDTNHQNYEIVLKKWIEIHPGTEFRCFVRDKMLIGISPRDWPQYHEHIAKHSNEILIDIELEFTNKICNIFPLDSYCFDIIRLDTGKIIFVDFSGFNSTTEPLAFDWDYLEDCESDAPEFRFLSEDVGIQPNSRNNFGIPKDIVDMFIESGDPTNSLQNLIDNFANRNVINE